MWHLLTTMKRNLWNMRKSGRVADENIAGAELPMFVGGDDDVVVAADGRRRHGWNNNGFSILYAIVRAPLSLISCISHPHVSGADGVWVSGDFTARISEMNHLMVTDSMRYAILM
ncbi:uncharacterized protein LOC122643114 [Telopea speciosissima]|uniref:uncharacterized protein LOC122643114 n=1 Tax=Telopea speciosissima TaxID=54955 RepID=UPI001CC57605|nr:uncharacterized protein LOC122643114 [Telopea speciosissima]